MSHKSLITIIVPIYNVDKYLKSCVNSIINQTYKNLEIILVNDGSIDSGSLICNEYARQDERVKVIHKKNGGVSSARNAGLDICKGDFVMFVDPDDYIAEDLVEHLRKMIAESGSDITSCDYLTFLDGTEPIISTNTDDTRVLLNRENAVKNMLYQKEIAAAPFGKLFKRSLFGDIRFPENVKIGEDMQTVFNVLLKANRVTVSSQKKYYYRIRPNSAMQKEFSTERMQPLDFLADIINNPSYSKSGFRLPAINRIFTEAFFINPIIPKTKQFVKERNKCISIIKEYRKDVILDKNSLVKYRIYALLSLLGPNSVTFIERFKSIIRKIAMLRRQIRI